MLTEEIAKLAWAGSRYLASDAFFRFGAYVHDGLLANSFLQPARNGSEIEAWSPGNRTLSDARWQKLRHWGSCVTCNTHCVEPDQAVAQNRPEATTANENDESRLWAQPLIEEAALDWLGI